ncbi:low affinity iron permease family protein [Bradyrhizobium sp. CCBAU 051011]|uniref:low affinity iron permease family protein n=1 Tax=Bradyrhizobium sp. CCBAU 051011 TaxID=858422 RepID=UPI00137ABD5D
MADKRAAVERQNQPHADQASQFFADVANAAARAAGRALTFLLAVGLIVVWAITGRKAPFSIPKNSTSGRRVCRHGDLCRPSVTGGRLLADCER